MAENGSFFPEGIFFWRHGGLPYQRYTHLNLFLNSFFFTDEHFHVV